MSTAAPCRILGLDPGLRVTGWGVVTAHGARLIYGAHGVIKTPEASELPARLAFLFNALKAILDEHRPDEAAVEETFVNNNPASTLRLGAARGVVVLAPAQFGIPVSEYAANRVKRAVVGVGHADKDQVAAMVCRLLPTAGEVRQDAADALAVAICHAHFRQTQQRWSP